MEPFKPHILPAKNIDWDKFITLIGQANAELARYDGILQSISNPELLLAPLSAQEAVLSSRIEGTQASLKDILMFEAKKDKSIALFPDIQEVINYKIALDHGIKRIEKDDFPISLRLIKEMHKKLMFGVRGEDKDPGNFRRIQNWIGIRGSKIEDATYIPPSPENILPALDNLEKYIHDKEKDKLVQLAIVHGQFEIIHPFIDGNGRLGRILIPLFLFEKKLLTRPLFFISTYFEANRDLYYNKLNSISNENNWNNWIEYFLNTFIHQSQRNITVVKKIISLYEEMKNRVVELTHSQFAIKIIDTMFSMVIFNSSEFIKKSKIPRDSAQKILKNLRDNNLIRIVEAGKGNKPAILVFDKLFRIVNDRS